MKPDLHLIDCYIRLVEHAKAIQEERARAAPPEPSGEAKCISNYRILGGALRL